MKKSEYIEQILKIAKKGGNTALFDKLNDKSVEYLQKLLKVCEKL